MESTSKPTFWTRTKIIVAALLCLLLALGAFLVSQRVNPNAFFNRPNAENLNELTEEELVEAQEEIEQSFMLVPESAVMVSHVNVKALTPEAEQQWWDEWFFRTLPPEMTNLRSLDGLEGLNSITVASYRPVQEFDPENVGEWIDYPLLYTVIFNVDSEFANQTRDLIAERNNNPETIITLPPTMGGFLDENGAPLDNDERTQAIAVTQMVGVEFIESLNQGVGTNLIPNLDWFGVDAEPTLYLNVSQYLESFSSNSDVVFEEANADIKEAMLGIDRDKDFIWIGESLDFGKNWNKKKDVEENETNSNDPSLISAEKFQEVLSGTMTPGLIDTKGNVVTPNPADPEQDVLVEVGAADMGLTPLLESISIKQPGQQAIGVARDPYSASDGTTAQPAPETSGSGDVKAPTEEDIIVVISPIYLLNVYKGSIAPSFTRTLTFTFRPDDSSTLTFDFKTEEQMLEDSKEVDEGTIQVDEADPADAGFLPAPDETITEEITPEP